MLKLWTGIAFALIWVVSATGVARAEAVDDGAYAELLRAHVRDGVVDYAGFKRDEARLDDFLERSGRVDPAGLPLSHSGQDNSRAHAAVGQPQDLK